MKKNKITIILQIVLIATILIFIGVMIHDFITASSINKNSEEILSELDEQIDKYIVEVNNNELIVTDVQNTNTVIIQNYKVYGKIKIDSIGIEYPILEYNSNTLKNNICNLSEMPINGTGNLSMAGHNTSNGALFGKLKKVKKGDIIIITNIYGQVYKYKVNNIVVVNPDDNSLLDVSEKPIVTLVTCTNSGKQRLIVQGELI